jgi:hypothetical protein
VQRRHRQLLCAAAAVNWWILGIAVVETLLGVYVLALLPPEPATLRQYANKRGSVPVPDVVSMPLFAAAR